ncbi:thioredoxin-like protein 4A isoform X3 [Canis lupus dingo]|nr:thioredoxin-like protein 4A isoform X3 [Canis lupus dingo]XP_048967469.1 thioredoxin-like protein 4A isoform X3 [Canis lupus dingo]
MYELYDPCTVMFFFSSPEDMGPEGVAEYTEGACTKHGCVKIVFTLFPSSKSWWILLTVFLSSLMFNKSLRWNKHIMIDLGTGNNNKINWAMEDKQEMIDIIETVYRGARKGRGLVVSPKDYSTKYRY